MDLYIYLKIAENNIERSELFDDLNKARDEMMNDVKQHYNDYYDGDTTWQEVVSTVNADGEFVDDDNEFSIGTHGGYSHMDSDENIDWYILHIKPGQTCGPLT